ncbi:MAG TPA: hypothetical protein VNY05_14260 [Candidatus Acidoferrales bacterium]|nr:hypothetical protein [Candidatus Acidoferrales bacterium]
MSTVQRTEPTVREGVAKIRNGKHAAMPPAQLATVGAAVGSGRTAMTIKNSTAYELSIFFDGPVAKKLTLAPRASQDLDLAPGAFQVAGRVAAANVLPFYGEQTYSGSARYSVTFYIGPHLVPAGQRQRCGFGGAPNGIDGVRTWCDWLIAYLGSVGPVYGEWHSVAVATA